MIPPKVIAKTTDATPGTPADPTVEYRSDLAASLRAMYPDASDDEIQAILDRTTNDAPSP